MKCETAEVVLPKTRLLLAKVFLNDQPYRAANLIVRLINHDKVSSTPATTFGGKPNDQSIKSKCCGMYQDFTAKEMYKRYLLSMVLLWPFHTLP